MMNQLKEFIKSASVLIASLTLICLIISLAQLEQRQKDELVASVITYFNR